MIRVYFTGGGPADMLTSVDDQITTPPDYYEFPEGAYMRAGYTSGVWVYLWHPHQGDPLYVELDMVPKEELRRNISQ